MAIRSQFDHWCKEMSGIHSTITTIQTIGSTRIVEFESKQKKQIIAALLIENKQINDIIKAIKKRTAYYQILFVAKLVTNPDKDIIYANHLTLRDVRNHITYVNDQIVLITRDDLNKELGIQDNVKLAKISKNDIMCVWNLIKSGQIIRYTPNIHTGKYYYLEVE